MSDIDDTREILAALRDRLHARNVTATGPFPGRAYGWDYLQLGNGRHVHVQLDSAGYWQALVYDGEDLVRMADVDAGDWPGDPVREGEPHASE